jgi:hypothetical protein
MGVLRLPSVLPQSIFQYLLFLHPIELSAAKGASQG